MDNTSIELIAMVAFFVGFAVGLLAFIVLPSLKDKKTPAPELIPETVPDDQDEATQELRYLGKMLTASTVTDKMRVQSIVDRINQIMGFIKDKPEIKYIQNVDKNGFEDTVNQLLADGWEILSTSVGFVNSQEYDFQNVLQAILIRYPINNDERENNETR